MASEGAIIPQLVESVSQGPSPATCSAPMAGGELSSSAQPTISPCQTEFVLDEKTKSELFTDTFCRVCGAVLQFESHRNAHYEGKRHAQKVRLYFLNKELEEMASKSKREEYVNPMVDEALAKDKNKFCGLCNMVFSSPIVAQSHYVGKIHAKKVKQMSGEQSESTGEGSETSITTQTETDAPPDPKPAAPPEKSSQPEAPSEQLSSPAENEIDDPNKFCKLCSAPFNNPLVALQHYKGKKHFRNEQRRKMMEEMEDTGHHMDSSVTGLYVCPICSVTLPSIEMYQSHMQGNKHQLKENLVANLIKTSKKNYDSFENELHDYVKIQKARGLVPKTQFRQDKDPLDSAEDTEPAPPHPNHMPTAPYKYFGHHPKAYPPYNPVHSKDPRTGWEKPYRPPRPPLRMPMRTAPSRKHSPSSSDSSDFSSSSSSSSDESSGSYKKEKRHKRQHRSKEHKHHSKSRRENGSSSKKKRKVDDGDSVKEDCDKDKKADVAPVDKSKHKKDKKKKVETPTDKESKKHKKAKKVEDQRTEEELLWDESILGF